MIRASRIAALLCLLTASAALGQTKLETDFADNPMLNGWFPTSHHQFAEKNTWTAPDADAPGHITVGGGRWHTPTLSVRPFAYYRLSFEARTPEDAYWAAYFYDERNNVHPADLYSEIPASESWTRHSFVFMPEKASTAVNLYFEPQTDEPLDVRSVKVEAISEKEALAWADDLYERLPALGYNPPAERHARIPEAIETLENGGSLDVVVLGDSIANDLSNGLPHAMIERAYPGSTVTWISSIAGGKGAWYFKRKDRVAEKVIRHDPDLLVIAGVSHYAHVPSIRTVIQQARDGVDDLEVLVMPGVITPLDVLVDGLKRDPVLNREEARRKYASFPDRLQGMAREMEVEYLGIREAWERYLDRIEKPREWFMRDGIHANARGKQIAARIVARYFAPVE